LRASAGEVMPEGHSLDGVKELSSAWARCRKLDYLSVNAAGPFAVPPMTMPPAPMVNLAAEIKQVVDLPVFTAIRINNPATAEQIIRNNEADMVGMGRALICDPDLPRKAREGRVEDIRHCIACNEGCWHRFCRGEPITCVQNPEAGFEGRRMIKPAAEPKKVLIIGGGCAGMEAAVVAHQRGHHAMLCEKTGELGGAIRMMAMAPNRQEFGQAVRFLKHELERLLVEVHMHTDMTLDAVLKENPDAVVVATGGLVITNPSATKVGPKFAIEIAAGTHVLAAEDVLRRNGEAGQCVVVADCQDHLKGLLAAEILADQGKQVTVILSAPRKVFTSNPYRVELITHDLQLQRLKTKGVNLVRDQQVKKARPGWITIRDVFTNAEQDLAADSLVLSYSRESNDALYFRLKGKVSQLYRIGDALAPRLLMDAIHEGYRVATQI
ncbi:MAG TPA: FAD-dependent oxidoreductase, partial [Pseudolabrys sp.]